MVMATREQVEAAMQIVVAVGDTIRALGTVPSGELYARLMGKFSLADYESIIGTLISVGVVKRDRSHLLHWIGPKEVK
jgi:hypothetical protein